jgi:hypothetical protein
MVQRDGQPTSPKVAQPINWPHIVHSIHMQTMKCCGILIQCWLLLRVTMKPYTTIACKETQLQWTTLWRPSPHHRWAARERWTAEERGGGPTFYGSYLPTYGVHLCWYLVKSVWSKGCNKLSRRLDDPPSWLFQVTSHYKQRSTPHM